MDGENRRWRAIKTSHITACRCFNYIEQMTQDERIKELCEEGRKYAKAMHEEIQRLRKEADQMKAGYWEVK